MNEKYENKGLTGLGNLGNTCYLNSVTQIYSNCLELNDFLDTITNLNKTVDSLLLLEYNEIRNIIWKKNVTIIPKKYVSIIFKIYKSKELYDFSSFIQNDFMEFYDLLNDAFHNAIKNIESYNFNYKNDFILSRNTLVNSRIKNDKYIKFIYNVFENDYSVMKDIFYGVFEMNIISKKKSNILSSNYDLFNSLSLGLEKKQGKTIQDLLNDYFNPELLCGDNMYYNENTNEKEEVFKDLKIKRFPKVLCIHLKRFTYDLKKIRYIVDFNENIQMGVYSTNINNKKNYELFGLVMHSGGFGGGHYYVIIKNMNGNWYNYNDTSVKKCDINKINKSHVYCLFYKLLTK